jgi:hypothetical protein
MKRERGAVGARRRPDRFHDCPRNCRRRATSDDSLIKAHAVTGKDRKNDNPRVKRPTIKELETGLDVRSG